MPRNSVQPFSHMVSTLPMHSPCPCTHPACSRPHCEAAQGPCPAGNHVTAHIPHKRHGLKGGCAAANEGQVARATGKGVGGWRALWATAGSAHHYPVVDYHHGACLYDADLWCDVTLMQDRTCCWIPWCLTKDWGASLLHGAVPCIKRWVNCEWQEHCHEAASS